MIAIEITEELKNQNELTELVGAIKTYSDFPNKFWASERVIGGYRTRTDLHALDGFKTLERPSYDIDTQFLGAIYLDVQNDYFTYYVENKTDDQIQSEKIAESEVRKQEIIQADIIVQAESNAQNSDDDSSLDNQDIFPLWSGDSVEYALDYKVQSFNAENELVLYKVVQAHTSQPNWNPANVEALFTQVARSGEILVWEQPSGAQDAYNIGDQVWFPDIDTKVYESLIDANVWSPIAYPQGWQEII